MLTVDPTHALMIALTNHRGADGEHTFSWEGRRECRSTTEVLVQAVTHLLQLTDRKL